MRTMYDAIDASQLPVGGDLYAGYVDGRWPSENAIRQRFPDKLVVGIATSPAHNEGVIGDGPPDNGTWPQWVAWVLMRRIAGADPWINTNASSWQAGKDAFAEAQVAEPHWWIADYDGDPAIPAGALMKQYASNGGYDTSSCAAYLPGIDPKPKPPAPVPAPVPVQEDDMATLYICPRTNATDAPKDVFKLEGGKYLHVTGGAGDPSYGEMLKHFPVVPISYAMHLEQLAAYGGTPVAA